MYPLIDKEYCDCGEEGSRGVRFCKMLKKSDCTPSSVREKLVEKFNVIDLGTLVVIKTDGTIVTENGCMDIITLGGPFGSPVAGVYTVKEGKEIELIKEWKEYDAMKSNEFCEIIKGTSLIKADESTKVKNLCFFQLSDSQIVSSESS